MEKILSLNELSAEGYCLTKNPKILNYFRDNLERIYPESHCKGGIAWKRGRWYPITQCSSRPKVSEEELLSIIDNLTKPKYDGVLSGVIGFSSDTIMLNASTSYAVSPSDDFYSDTSIKFDQNNLKLRIKCQNLKKNSKTYLLKTNLKSKLKSLGM